MLLDGPSLFDFAVARRTDRRTSIEAAQSLKTERVTDLMEKVLRTIERRGDATMEEVADATGLSIVTVSPRFRPLERAGKIVNRGQRRMNRSGRTAIVWIPSKIETARAHTQAAS